MSRYERLFANRPGIFCPFVMLGDPDLETSARILDALIEGGADMIEVGIPFSDLVADGPGIQAAAVRALERGVRPADCFRLLRRFRAKHPEIPVGILTYANLVMARGFDGFYAAAADAGADSVLVADVPVFEAAPFAAAARANGVEPVLIAASNTPKERLAEIARMGGGYTYCVARAGVTGADEEVRFEHTAMLGALKTAGAPPPVFGFGIARPEHVRAALAAGAAGAISGSAIVRLVQDGADPVAAVRAFVREMSEAAHEDRSGSA